MSEELGDMTWEEFEKEREEFEKEREEFEDAMSSLGKEIDRNVADTKELKRESIRRRAELDQLDEMVKYLKRTVPPLLSIIALAKEHLSDDYIGSSPTIKEFCSSILELYKKEMK